MVRRVAGGVGSLCHMFRPPTPRHRRLREERPWLLGWGPEGLGRPGPVIVTSWPACPACVLPLPLMRSQTRRSPPRGGGRPPAGLFPRTHGGVAGRGTPRTCAGF